MQHRNLHDDCRTLKSPQFQETPASQPRRFDVGVASAAEIGIGMGKLDFLDHFKFLQSLVEDVQDTHGLLGMRLHIREN